LDHRANRRDWQYDGTDQLRLLDREEGRTGEEGLRACRFDLVLSYTVIGLFGVAGVIIGSRTSVRGQGNQLALLLALTLVIMNNRTAWVCDRLRASLALNLVLAAALGFFAFTAMHEVMRLAG
jgi:hypothetical protein